MFKNTHIKNILVVSVAVLVIPVVGFAMAMTADPGDGTNENNDLIKITSNEGNPEAASQATSVLTAGALGYIDAATSATAPNQNGQGGSPDAVSSATGNPGLSGIYQDDDDAYEYDDDESDDDESDEEDDD